MNYCLLEDAWSDYKNDQTTNNDQTTHNDQSNYSNHLNDDKIIEHFDINYDIAGNLTTNVIKPIEKHIRGDHMNIYTCDDFIKHLGSCKNCRMRLQKNVSSRILTSLKNIILNNKDTIVLLLIILFMIVFINLIISIFRR